MTPERPFRTRLIAVLCAGCLWSASHSVAAEESNSRVEHAYYPARSQKYQPVMDRLKQRRVLELLSEFLAPIRLPHRLYLVTMECDRQNASPYYDSKLRSIIFCYEFLDLIGHVAPNPGQLKKEFTRDEIVVGTFIGIALHELGHALFHVLEVPVFGREEDAADQLASFIALQFNRDLARTVIRGLAFSWSMVRNPKEWEHYADEHGTAAQRFYNAICLAYGAESEWFKEVVDNGWLPQDRAENCAREYQQVRYAFTKTILPFIDQDLMQKVRARDWLKAVAPK